MELNRLVVLATAMLWSGGALAEKPPWAGQGRDKKVIERGQGETAAPSRQRGAGPSVRVVVHFGDGDRNAVRSYFGGLGGAGRCPPGLAKKGNGCLPPGQAKKWQRGRALPGSIVFHPIAPSLLAQLRPPLAGHRYVRIAGDILMIAIGTSLVVDAIEDLGRQ